MTHQRRFLIAKHGDIITATELDGTGSQATFTRVLRFTSVSELIAQFADLGASADMLQNVRDTWIAHGMAILEFQAAKEAAE